MDSREQQMTEMFQGLKNYSQQPPASVYKGIRKKLWWSEFMSFSMASLNVYYVGLLIAGATGAAIYATPGQNATTGDFSNRTHNDAQLQRSVIETTEHDQQAVSEQTVNYTDVQQNSASEKEATSISTHTEKMTANTAETETEENVNAETEENLSEKVSENSVELEVEKPERVADVPMKRIEPKSTESIESLPFDRASYSILPNLLEQINDTQSKNITLTLTEIREVEKEK